MKIERITDSDIEQVKNVVSRSFSIHPEFYSQRFPIRSDRCLLVARDGNSVVGIAGAFRNSLHPEYLEILLVVLPDYRQRGVASELFQELRFSSQEMSPFLGYRAAFFVGEPSSGRFLETNGFAKSHICRCLELSLLQPRVGLGHSLSALGAAITLGAAREDGGLKDKVLEFLWLRYSEEHATNPPKRQETTKWEGTCFSECDNELSIVLLFSGDVVGVTTCCSIDGMKAELMWSYATKDDGPELEKARLSFMIGQLMEECARRGAATLALEVDETDHCLTVATEKLPLQKREDWVIYLGK